MLFWLFFAVLLASPAVGEVTFSRGQKFQIILTGTPDTSKSPLPPIDAPVWDVDLFDNDAATIKSLKASGKIVICYFSAGTREDWRDDAKDFPAADQGKVLPEWPNEKWIRTGSTKIREIMAKRIKIGADKGCDAIDPDNTGTSFWYASRVDLMRKLHELGQFLKPQLTSEQMDTYVFLLSVRTKTHCLESSTPIYTKQHNVIREHTLMDHSKTTTASISKTQTSLTICNGFKRKPQNTG